MRRVSSCHRELSHSNEFPVHELSDGQLPKHTIDSVCNQQLSEHDCLISQLSFNDKRTVHELWHFK